MKYAITLKFEAENYNEALKTVVKIIRSCDKEIIGSGLNEITEKENVEVGID